MPGVSLWLTPGIDKPSEATSGGRGLHVFVPLRRGAVQDRVRAYASAIAAEMAAEHPGLVTIESRKARRRAPVYLDVMRNAAGQTIVPPFSVRWRPGAPVSMPLDWDEVSPRLDPNVFTIRTAERRMGAKAPWSSFFGHRQTLPHWTSQLPASSQQCSRTVWDGASQWTRFRSCAGSDVATATE